MKTIRNKASEQLRLAGIESAVLDSDLLLMHVLQVPRAQLIAESCRNLSETEEVYFWQLITRRAKREPLAYILEQKEFWGLSFFVDSSVLIPRPETEQLIERALAFVKQRGKKELSVLDLCTGSGCIIISLVKALQEIGVSGAFAAVDISSTALATAKHNARVLGTEQQIRFFESNLFSAVDGQFDVIITNPPYLSASEMNALQPELVYEPSLALEGGLTGVELPTALIEEAARYLKAQGLLLLEHGAAQGDVLRITAKKYFFSAETYKDLQGFDRILCAAIS